MNARARIPASGRAFSILTAGILTLGLLQARTFAGQIQQITGFGSNPTGIGMYLYTPSNVSAKPAVLVGIHACHGKGTDVCANGTAFASQSDKYGFLLVCPSAISSDGCWDVHSNADLTHNGGGDASGIISMVNYVVQNKGGDVTRVYVAGHSSGGMMTNVMLGSYPDVFKAGAAFAGVAFGCFAAGAVDNLGWNATCATGNVSKTGMQWGDIVRAAYVGFTGTRPRMQLWHGTTDATVNFKNFGEEIKEWTNVLGVSETATSTENNAIQSSWIRTRYTDSSGVVQVEAIQETGQPHNLVVDMADAVKFFGLDGSNPVPDAGSDAALKDGGADVRAGTGGSSGGLDGGGLDGGPGGGSGRGTGGNGVSGSGGSSVATGGNDGSGGALGSGGNGADAAGGSGHVGTGGSVSGASATGGNSASGGGTAPPSDAGAKAGSNGQSGGTASGCSCDLGAGIGSGANRQSMVGLGWLFVVLGFWRRRGAKARSRSIRPGAKWRRRRRGVGMP